MNTPSTTIWSTPNPDNSSTPEDIPICRGVYDLAQPWTPSPPTESAASIQEDPLPPTNSRHPGTSISIEGQSSDAKSRKVVWKRLKRLLGTVFSDFCVNAPESLTTETGSNVPSPPDQTHPAVRRRVVPNAGDWRAYGYWACPRVNNVNVNNRCTPFSRLR